MNPGDVMELNDRVESKRRRVSTCPPRTDESLSQVPAATLRSVEILPGHCAVVWSEAPVAAAERVLLYLHAGARECCELGSHQRLLAEVCLTLQASLLMVDYQAGTGHRAHDGVDAGVSAYRALIENDYSPLQIVLAVDSSDSELAIMLPRAIAKTTLPPAESVVSIPPLTDLPSRYRPETTVAGQRASCPSNPL